MSPDVLLVRAGALGDVLLLRRAVHALGRAGRRVRLLAPAGPGQALVGPGPSEVASLTPLDGLEMAGLLAGTPASPALERALRADAIVALTDDADLQDQLRPFAARLLSRSSRPSPRHHASHWLAAPTRELGADPTMEPPALVFTPEESREAGDLAALLGPGFLAIHPGSGSAVKNWPARRFAALARAIAPRRRCLLVLGPADEEVARPLVGVPGVVLARELPVRTLGALLSQAGLYVGNDSGVSHLAAAAGAATLALFGPTDPEVWGPVGPAVETVRSPTGGMEGLELDLVLAAVQRLRGARPRGFRA